MSLNSQILESVVDRMMFLCSVQFSPLTEYEKIVEKAASDLGYTFKHTDSTYDAPLIGLGYFNCITKKNADGVFMLLVCIELVKLNQNTFSVTLRNHDAYFTGWSMVFNKSSENVLKELKEFIEKCFKKTRKEQD
jgi:hypothetical protein